MNVRTQWPGHLTRSLSISKTGGGRDASATISRWLPTEERFNTPSMKSCLGLLVTLLVFTIVIGGGALIWYLSYSAEFSRAGKAPAAASAMPPKATPVKPPVAIPVRPADRR